MLKGHVFKKQLFGNQIFALFIDTFLGKNSGILGNYKNKMAISYNNSDITIDTGVCCIRGRFLEEDAYTTLNAGTDGAFCKLVLEIDLDKENTETDLNQASYKIIKSATDYPNLTQNDIIENNAGIYQFELARFKTSIAGITDFKDMRIFLDFESIYTNIFNIIKNLEDESSLVFKKDLIAKDIQVNFNNNFTLIEKDCCVIGNEVYITIRGSFKSTQTNQYMEIGTIEENYRPPLDIYFVALKEGMASVVDALIDTNGVVKLYNTGQNPVGKIDANNEVRIHTHYPIGLRQGSITPPVLN